MAELTQRLSINLRRCRERRGMSLGEVAAAAGLAKSTLHALEQGSGNPTLSTVWALATALAVPLGGLLEEGAPQVSVVRAGEGPVVESESVRARLLHRIEVHGVVEVFELAVGERCRVSAPHRPGVTECLLVTSGTMRTGPTEQPVELMTGDSVHFDASLSHSYQAVSGLAGAVLVMTYQA